MTGAAGTTPARAAPRAASLGASATRASAFAVEPRPVGRGAPAREIGPMPAAQRAHPSPTPRPAGALPFLRGVAAIAANHVGAGPTPAARSGAPARLDETASPAPRPAIAPSPAHEAAAPRARHPATASERDAAPAAANHAVAGPVPAARDTSDTRAALPDALKARLAAIVGARAVAAARLHTGPAAHARASDEGARAIAVGEDVFFADGAYLPGTREGDALIAHELAHVDQAQRGLLHQPARKAQGGAAPGALEAAAEQAAARSRESTGEPAAADKLESELPTGGHRALETAEAAAATPAEVVPAMPAAAATEPLAEVPTAAPAPQATESAVATPEAEAASEVPAVPQAAPQAAPARGTVPPSLPRMPEPATTLSSKELGRVAAVKGRAGRHATATARAPSAAEDIAAARAAVRVPQQESNARAAEQLVVQLADRKPPSPEIVALGARIKLLIRQRRPADQEGVIDTRPQQVATEAGRAVEGDVQRDVDSARTSYGAIGTRPTGPTPAAPGAIQPLPEQVEAPEVNAAAATPDAVSPEHASLGADTAEMDARAKAAGLDEETAQLVQHGPVAEARDARNDMKGLAAEGPAEALKQQQAALAQANTEMTALQQEAVASLKAARKGHGTSVKQQQEQDKGGEEALRAKLSAEASEIYDDARKRVEDWLARAPAAAMRKWSTHLPPISNRFQDDLKVVTDRVTARHSGAGGWFVAGWDAVTGLPGWATAAYDRAERNFGNDVCALLNEISSDVNTVIHACNEIIADARRRIAQVFTAKLPDGLKDWAAREQRAFEHKLDQLHDRVEATRTRFNQELIDSAGGAVQAAREQIQKLRQAARGLWGQFLDALAELAADPFRFIVNGLLDLVGIPHNAFWALVDKIQQVVTDIARQPVKFASNLMAGIAAGFERFFAHFSEHAKKGFFDWLFSGLKSLGVQIPPDFSLKSIITFFLQLMGISWLRIRKMLADVIGEKYVAAAEKALRLVELIAQGPQGILDLLKDKLSPEALLERVLQMAIDYVVKTLIKQVAAAIAKLLVPGGVVLQALETIYEVLKWIFHNAARIFHFVEAVVNAMAAVLAGDLGVVASAVEAGLAMLIPPVIDFLAELLHLGDLPDKIAEIVKSLQAWIEELIKSVIKFLVETAKRLLASLGLGGKQDEAAKPPGQVGETLTFTSGEETHKLYIDVIGKDATVKVESSPMTASEWLTKKEQQLPELGPEDKQKPARSAIDAANTLISKTDKEADQVAAANAAALEPKPAETAAPGASAELDAQLKTDEEAVAAALQQVLEAFGAGKPSGKWAADIAKSDPNAVPVITEVLDADPKKYLKPKDWLAVTKALTPDAKISAVLDKPLLLEHAFGSAAHGNQAVPAVGRAIASLGDDAPDKQAEEAVSGYKAQVHARTQPFISSAAALAEQVFLANQKSGATATLQAEFRDKLAQVEQEEHKRFKPLDLTEVKVGDRVIAIDYRTEAGSTFHVTFDASGMVESITGTGLQLKGFGEPRGYTGEAGRKTIDQGIDSAHLIADRFGGSGYAAAANLISASAAYNRVDMLNVEDRIAQWVFGNKISMFSMKVKVAWGAITGPAATAAIQAAYPEYAKPKKRKKLEGDLRKFLDENSKNLKRCMSVTYVVTSDDGKLSKIFTLGPDVHLGLSS